MIAALAVMGGIMILVWAVTQTSAVIEGNAPTAARSAKTAGNLPRSVRNKNPGNQRPLQSGTWRGQIGVDKANLPAGDPGYCIFKTVSEGARAMFIDVGGDYFNDRTRTLNGLIAEYAPAADGNAPDVYAQRVADKTGLPRDKEFAANRLRDVLLAMIGVETGQSAASAFNVADLGAGFLEGARYLGVQPVSAGLA